MNNIFVILAFLFWSAIGIYGEINPYLEALKKRPWKSEQKYVEVRPGVHLFYWFYFADGIVKGAYRKPLIIWIQGGPSLAATGIANFAEIGPLKMDLTPRNHTWVNGRNVLLIDHPVGTGFSYCADKSLFVKTDREMATDLSRVIKSFLKSHKEFRQTPSYLFGQSYGGKIAPRLGLYLQSAIERNKLKMNLKGIGIGSGWVNPKESTLMYPQYLYNMGAIDQNTFIKSKAIVKRLVKFIEIRNFEEAAKLDTELFKTLIEESDYETNFNNINQISPYQQLEKLAVIINRYVKPTLAHVVNQSLDWNYFSDDVYNSLSASFLIPTTNFLEMLLNRTNIKIAVYNGNFDVVTPLAGASNWVHKLNWHGAKEFRNTKRLKINGFRNGFYKTVKQFSFWWVFGSGHWIPEDNPVAMEQILNHVIESND